MTACGGGGKDSSPPLPAVTDVSPRTALIGTQTTFDVTGSNLTEGMRFTLAGCNGITEKAGGSPSKRQFTCTPVGAVAAYRGQVSTSATTASTSLDFSVNFRSPILSASVASGRMLVVTADGTLWGWGRAVGDGTNNESLVAKKIGSDFISTVDGEFAVLAIKKDGSLWSWGFGEVLGTANQSSVLAPVQIGSGFAKVSIEWKNTTSGEHAIGLKTDGSLWVWGARSLPTGQYGFQYTPRMFASGFSDLGANDTALKADGSVWEWSVNTMILSDSDAPDNSFVVKQIGTGYSVVSGGFNVTFGLKPDGSLWNWGNYAIRPAGSSGDLNTHYLVSSDVRSISSGNAMIIKSDNTLWYPGGNVAAQSGEYIAVWPGDNCTMALKTDGSLLAWGLCYFGDGQSSHYTQPANTPAQVVFPK
ncbi:RCC1 domain-containing protein [Undibacterium sp. Xuan67W]|uniref:RCC1 domain-containing protein n=1 Tax=Undibacterium sp. Xuan67W TaxID=3413057 RepID=UPI003BF08885